MNVTPGISPAARAQAFGITTDPVKSDPLFTTIPDMTVSITTFRPDLVVSFSATVMVVSNDNWDLAVFVDGVEFAGGKRNVNFFGGSIVGLVPAKINGLPIETKAVVMGLAPGDHVIDVRWKANAGEARVVGIERQLLVYELV